MAETVWKDWLVYMCKDTEALLKSEHFYELLKIITTNEEIEEILREVWVSKKVNDNTKREKLKSFLESDITRNNWKIALGVVAYKYRHNNPTSDYIRDMLWKDWIDILTSRIATYVGIILFEERDRKTSELWIPEIPSTWKWNDKLEARYNTLKLLALNNEEWWLKVWNRLRLFDEKIVIDHWIDITIDWIDITTSWEIKYNHAEIPVNCVEERITWTKYMRRNVFELARTFKEYKRIYDFITESVELWIDKEALMWVLWILEHIYLLKGEWENNSFAKWFNFENWTKTLPMNLITWFFVLYPKITN